MPGYSAPAQKLEALHADTCLPDYWGGHHLPHIVVPVHREMTLKGLKQSLIDELHEGCVCGANAPACNDDQWFRQARMAVNNITALHPHPEEPGLTPMFEHLEPDEDDDATIYAYFVFKEVE